MTTKYLFPIFAIVLNSAAFSSFAADPAPLSSVTSHAVMMNGNKNPHTVTGINSCMPASVKIAMNSNAAEHIQAAMIHDNAKNGQSEAHQQMAAEHMAQAYQ